MQTSLRIAALAVLVAAPAHADFTVVERGGHWTEAEIVVDATPTELYALATNYERWREVFSDIKSVRVVGGDDRANAKVQFDSRALEHEVTVQFENVPGQALRFRGIKGPPGGRARGEYLLESLDGGTRTRVRARLYMDVVGIAGVFVRDAALRRMRQDKLTRDLRDIQQWASRRHPQS